MLRTSVPIHKKTREPAKRILAKSEFKNRQFTMYNYIERFFVNELYDSEITWFVNHRSFSLKSGIENH